MIASRALGCIGGTVDKLEGITGFRAELSAEEMQVALEEVGLFIANQSHNVSPVEKKFNDLRCASATVFSDPLTTGNFFCFLRFLQRQ